MEIGNTYFNKYKVVSILGHGGTSEVFLVENIRVGNKWAMKKAKKGNYGLNLLAEPTILKNLDHYAIPKIIDIEEDEEAFYIIEEYIEGINLKEYKMNCTCVEQELIIKWAYELCDVLKYLHNRKPFPIIYRDMKPDNIMLMDNGKLKLIDFGIAREYKEENEQDTVPIGTKGYAAPEQYGIGQSDERTDIFSLGITLYYFITGKNLSHPPYKIQTFEQINLALEKRLFDIVLKCCEILPDQRYQKIEELEEDLIKLIHEEESLKEEYRDLVTPAARKDEQSFVSVKKTMIIATLGVSKGVGVTHSTIMMGGYLSKRSKVAIVEYNDSKHFKEIGLITKEEKEIQKKNFIYNKIHYFWDVDFDRFLSQNREKFDFILLDLGSYEEGENIKEFIRADVRLVICHGMDWKMREIEKFIQENKAYDPNNHWVYIVPFMDKKSLRDLKASIGNKVFYLPYNMNPFILGQDTKRMFEKILKSK